MQNKSTKTTSQKQEIPGLAIKKHNLQTSWLPETMFHDLVSSANSSTLGKSIAVIKHTSKIIVSIHNMRL